MTLFNFMFFLILATILCGVLVLSVTSFAYYGVVALMSMAVLCCFLMVVMGRTFMALVILVVYLGGMMVIFGYCVSVEKDLFVRDVISFKFFVQFFVLLCGIFCLWLFGFGVDNLFPGIGGCYVWPEVNGFGVLYCDGGFGLTVCLWGLLVTLFSILVILQWGKRGGYRSF